MDQEEIKEETNNELDECKKLCDEYLAGWQRCKADFLNYKKEEAARIGALLEFSKANWFLKILPVLDNFERAMKNAKEDLKGSEWFLGIEQIENQLKGFLKAEGIEEIKAIGEKFNPELHEAVEQVANEAQSGTIIEVLEKGYTINNKLLRPAKVKVAK